MSESEWANETAEEPVRPPSYTWRAPEGARVYGRDEDAPVPDDSPILPIPHHAVSAEPLTHLHPAYAPPPPNWNAAPQQQILAPQQQPYPPQYLPPPAMLPGMPPPEAPRVAWPQHIGPARTPDEVAHKRAHSAPPPPAPQYAYPPPPIPSAYAPPPPAPHAQILPPPLPPQSEYATPPTLSTYVPPHMGPIPDENDAPAPESREAALQSASGLAWTALLVAVLIPPVGIGMGWFCIGIARSEESPALVPLARKVVAVSSIAMVVGAVSLVCLILLLVASSN